MDLIDPESNYFIIKDKVFRPFIGRTKILGIVDRIAGKINLDYKDKYPLFLVVLKGSIFFASDLIARFKGPCSIEFIRAKSYGSSMSTSGNVVLTLADLDIDGRNIQRKRL